MTRDYYPHGLEMPGRVYVSGAKTKEGYTGHELDAETGLNYAGARYYDPAIARWTSVDPLVSGFPSHSPYNYAMGDPVNAVDPDGKCVIFVDGQKFSSTSSQSYWNSHDNPVVEYYTGEDISYVYVYIGGWRTTFLGGRRTSSLWSDNRHDAGYDTGVNMLLTIINQMQEGETIKILSHKYGSITCSSYG